MLFAQTQRFTSSRPFVSAASNLVTGDIAAQSTDALAAIDKADVTIVGDKASVQFASARDAPVKLEKVDGRWKLPLWLMVLFPHRAWRDDQRCRAKYGALWQDYCRRVPYRIIPWIY